jgi:hypothetical protein
VKLFSVWFPVLAVALFAVVGVAMGVSGTVSFSNVPTIPDDDNGTWETISDPRTTLNYTELGGGVNYRTVVATPGGGPWTKVRITVVAETDEKTDDLSASICIRSGSSDDCTESPTQILWSSSSDVVIGTNETIVSDPISFSFNSADTLLFNTHTANGEGRYLWVGDGSAYYKIASDETMTQSVSSYTSDPHKWNYELIEGWNPD